MCPRLQYKLWKVKCAEGRVWIGKTLLRRFMRQLASSLCFSLSLLLAFSHHQQCFEITWKTCFLAVTVSLSLTLFLPPLTHCFFLIFFRAVLFSCLLVILPPLPPFLSVPLLLSLMSVHRWNMLGWCFSPSPGSCWLYYRGSSLSP